MKLYYFRITIYHKNSVRQGIREYDHQDVNVIRNIAEGAMSERHYNLKEVKIEIEPVNENSPEVEAYKKVSKRAKYF